LSPSEIGLLIAASLFAGGLATLLQTLGLPFFGCQLPLVQGVSFSGVATMVAILGAGDGGGMPAVLGAVMAASLIGLLITPVFSRITKFFPPLVTGIVITTIGLTLMPVAARWAMGGNSHAADFGSMANIGLAAVTLVHRPAAEQAGQRLHLAAVDPAGDGDRHPDRRGPGHGRLLQGRRRPDGGPSGAVPLRHADLPRRRDPVHVHRGHGDPGGNLGGHPGGG
jgi:hypothetical protein